MRRIPDKHVEEESAITAEPLVKFVRAHDVDAIMLDGRTIHE